MPLVKRALRVLADREVTPQLGLLKSTLLQLDSSFSERDYGSGSFRDFADKLAEHGIVSLKHQGRSTLVELIEGGEAAVASEPVATGESEPAETAPGAGAESPAASAAPGDRPSPGHDDEPRRGTVDAASLGDGVALVRRVLAETTAQPRWPMYPRQFKQFLRAADPAFDERKYGSIAELMRACQKDGLLKLERDRQGGLRVFAGVGGGPRASVPHGWSILAGGGQPSPVAVEDTGEGPEAPEALPPAAAAQASDAALDDDIGNRISGGAVDVTRAKLGSVGVGRPAPFDVEDEAQPDFDEAQPSAPKAKRARKGAPRKTAGAAKRPAGRRKRE
jgi:hypothetical protein